MRILPQIMIFDQTQNEEILGDLERLKNVIDNIPDGKLIHKLNEIRGKGRNDWPVLPMWHALLGGIVFQHRSDAELLRELSRNSQLRDLGYDKSSDSLRYGFYPQFNDKRVFRISCDTDKRIFVTVARDSKKWVREYKKRTSVERVNGRIDRDYKFEDHTIRGLKKLNMYITISFIAMLSMAKSKIEANNMDHLAALIS